MPNRHLLKRSGKVADDFNNNYPIGTPVILTKDSGETIRTLTRTKACTLASSYVVIWLEGIPGCYSLDRVRPIEKGEKS